MSLPIMTMVATMTAMMAIIVGGGSNQVVETKVLVLQKQQHPTQELNEVTRKSPMVTKAIPIN